MAAAKRDNAMKYCRVVFAKEGWPPLTIDFGYLDTDQRNASVKKLREQYADHSFRRCYSIPVPPPYQGRASKEPLCPAKP